MQVNADRTVQFFNSVTVNGNVNGDAGEFSSLRISAFNAPASPTDPGTPGEIKLDGGFIYVCFAPSSWLRAQLSTWTVEAANPYPNALLIDDNTPLAIDNNFYLSF